MGIPKGFKHSEETIERMRIAQAKRTNRYLFEKNNAWSGNRLGKKASEETKKRMSIAQSEEKGSNWKGDNVGYSALHKWITKKLGRIQKCELCAIRNAKKFEWANKSHLYKRDVSDWIRLCTKCHHRYDKEQHRPNH